MLTPIQKLAFKRLNSHKRLKISTSPRFVAFSPIAFEKTSLFEAKRRFRLFQKWFKCLNPIGALQKVTPAFSLLWSRGFENGHLATQNATNRAYVEKFRRLCNLQTFVLRL